MWSLSKEYLSYNDIKKEIKFPKKITKCLSELIGFHYGDGHYNTHKNKDYYFFYGGNKSEKDYYNNYIKKYFKKLFNISIKTKEFKKVYGFYLRSKGLYYFFNKILIIPNGKKK